MIDTLFYSASSHLAQSTVFAGAATLLTLAFRANRAQVRFWLWLSASLKFLIPFALLSMVGSMSVHGRRRPLSRGSAPHFLPSHSPRKASVTLRQTRRGGPLRPRTRPRSIRLRSIQ